MTVIFNENGLAIEPGIIRCFYYDAITYEYAGWSDEYIHLGVSMPANATEVDPGVEVIGMALIFKSGGWEQIEDHRGEIVYSTNDRGSVEINYLGKIHDGFVKLSPATPYDIWDGQRWVTDDAALQADSMLNAEKKKTSLRMRADQEIVWRQDAVDEGIATANEVAALAKWKIYRISVMRVDTANPAWPELPAA